MNLSFSLTKFLHKYQIDCNFAFLEEINNFSGLSTNNLDGNIGHSEISPWSMFGI